MKYQYYDDAVGTLQEKLTRQGKSMCVLYSFKKSTGELREYMESQGKDYSPGVAAEWLDTIKAGLSRERFKQLRHPQFLVASLIYGDDMMKFVFYPEAQSNYDKLPEWACHSIDDYLYQASTVQHCLSGLKTGVGTFLLRLVKRSGTKSVRDISWMDVVWYREEYEYVRGVHTYLEYLEWDGLCPPYLSCGYNKVFAPRIIIIKEPEQSVDDEKRYDLRQYHDAHQELLGYLKGHHYSKSIIKGADSSLNEFGLFLLANNLSCCDNVASAYISTHKARIGKCEKLFSRPIFLVLEILKKGFSSTFPMVYRSSDAGKIPGWISTEADAYIEERKAHHMAESTILMDYHSILRFASFLEGKGCRSVTDITIPLIKEFNLYDKHETIAGKQAYNRRIKGFLCFLGDKDLVPGNYYLALPTISSSKVRPVVTLSDGQYDRIIDYCHKPDTRLLDSAILLTALETGLRVSDMAGLRIQDIDWDNATLSIVQRKTRVHLRIPFTTGVGNAIWRYLREERPDIPDDHVFLYPRAPFRPVGGSIVRICMMHALKTHVGGGHITRKTFASRLLRNESPVSIISDLLGHQSDATIDPYLDTNTTMMRECALPLAQLDPYKGGLL
jgi:integrase